jgi:hypothetical protein
MGFFSQSEQHGGKKERNDSSCSLIIPSFIKYKKVVVPKIPEHIGIKEQTLLYLASKGGKLSPSPHPRFMEYMRLKLFWEKFGLNKFDLQKCSLRWIDELYQVHIAVEDFFANQKATAPSSNAGGSRIVREKLL